MCIRDRWDIYDDLGHRVMADIGPQQAHPTLGVSCTTVRPVMTAYNINLNTKDLMLARQIVDDLKRVRTDRSSMDKLDTRDVRYLAWFMPEFDCCQVSTNIYNVAAVSMSALYDHVSFISATHGVSLAGSELIGLATKSAITTTETLEEAFDKLRLDSVKPFDPETMILDRVLDRIKWSD